MSHGDFFTFCTSLRPLELKALGALSEVRHLGAGEIIYKPGDPADAVYSVNRGVVEVGDEGATPTFLTRGDVFGDAETLAGAPRKQLARAQDDVSMQCFHREKFAELSTRVPSFFQFLCEKLAQRIMRAGAIEKVDEERLELSGNLRNFDLVTIYQTIVTSAQTGELYLVDDDGQRVALFYFEDGKPRGGQFDHLTGEDAFYQLFISDELEGMFSFSAGARSLECVQSTTIEKSADDLLISALQSRDELQALKQIMPAATTALERITLRFTWEHDAPPELQPIAERIWRIAEFKRQTIPDLYRQNAVCELKIYAAVQELMRSGHLVVADEPPKSLCA